MVEWTNAMFRRRQFVSILALLLMTSALATTPCAAREDDPVPNGAPASEMQNPEDNLSNASGEQNPPMPPSPNGSRHGAGYDAPPPPKGAPPPPHDGNPPPPPPPHGDQGDDAPPILDEGNGDMHDAPPPPPPRNHP